MINMHTLVELNAANISAQGTHVPAFLAKLWKLIDDPTTNDLIYWSDTGNSFIIQNQAKFSRDLLPLYYKHNNMASFVRQLNMYGFHKVVSVEQGGLKLDKDEMEFAHPFFLRGHESSLELIKRKIPAAKHDESRIRPDNLQKVLMDVRQMKGRQENMDSKLLTMKRENEALWRELAALRQKHANQTTILSKILQFLVGMMSSPRSHRLAFKRRMPLMLNDTDGTKERKISRHQGQKSVVRGPLIRDVTEIFEADNSADEADISAELDHSDYLTGSSGSDGDTHPKVDCPSSVPSKVTAEEELDHSDYLIGSNGIDGGDTHPKVDDNTDPKVDDSPSIVPSKVRLTEDLDAHLDDMQVGLENLKELLKSDDYKMDNSTLLGVSWPLTYTSSNEHQLFGEASDLATLGLPVQFQDTATAAAGTGDSGLQGLELVSYNPSLFELTEEDSQFFDDSSNMLLNDELESMLTTERDKLNKAESQGGSLSFSTALNGQDQGGSNSIGGGGLTTPVGSASILGTISVPAHPPVSNVASITGAGKRKRK